MSSIGPSLPPHLQKRKIEHTLAKDNNSNGEDVGPSMPRPIVTPKNQGVSSVTTQEDKEEEEEEEEEEEDSFGPALPPHILAARRAKQPQSGPSPSSSSSAHFPSTSNRPSSGQPKRVVGPAAPPPPRSRYDSPYSDEEEEEEVGPSPFLASDPRSSRGDGVREFLEREERLRKEKEEASKPKVQERDSWMLKPPEASTLASTLGDPSNLLKPRGFASRTAEPVRSQDQSLWTETPRERQKRLEDELSGKKRKAEGSVGPALDDAEIAALKRRRKRDEEIQNSINQHNSAHRGASLLDSHSKATADKTGDDANASPAIWDRDLHMGVRGKRMDEKDRSQAIRDAKSLGDRFGHGRGGSYI